MVRISIHALREEGDPIPRYFDKKYEISIHALREEGDLRTMTLGLRLQKFLSTPSARRATAKSRWPAVSTRISIHALREEGDAI